MQLTTNFKLQDFACKDGSPVPDNKINNVQKLCDNLQIIRDTIDVPLLVLSGYRTPSWNKKVGGAKNSEHKNAKASDLFCRTLTPKQLHTVIDKLIKQGKIKDGGLSLYPTFVHYDIGKVRRWYYGK